MSFYFCFQVIGSEFILDEAQPGPGCTLFHTKPDF
jgi:hypothetical protein